MDSSGEESGDKPREPAVSLTDIPLHSTNLLTVLDKNGIVQYESPAIARLYGYDQQELVDEQVADYFHPEGRQRVLEAFQTIVSTDEQTVEAVEYRHLTADGTYLWVESVGSSNPTPEGHYVINSRDISVQKQRERELQAANERLEQFTAFVTHDLRNPLAVAQGYLDLAVEAESDHYETVAGALDRMETLIEELRADSTVEEPIVHREPLQLDTICETCWQHVSTANATLQTAVDHPIGADRFRLMQLLENLFRNAVDHNDDTVEVTVGTLDDGFYVADDGRGVPEAERDRMFERGYTTTPGGTGLGLDIVTQAAAAHDWELSVAESSDGGLRIEITGVETPSVDAT